MVPIEQNKILTITSTTTKPCLTKRPYHNKHFTFNRDVRALVKKNKKNCHSNV